MKAAVKIGNVLLLPFHSVCDGSKLVVYYQHVHPVHFTQINPVLHNRKQMRMLIKAFNGGSGAIATRRRQGLTDTHQK